MIKIKPLQFGGITNPIHKNPHYPMLMISKDDLGDGGTKPKTTDLINWFRSLYYNIVDYGCLFQLEKNENEFG